MRFLLIDPHGDALDVAIRAKQCEHDVRLFVRDMPRTCEIGNGLVEVVRDFRPWLEWADVTLMCDNVLYLREIDAFRAFRTKACIIGPTAETAAWELDRTKGFEVCRKHGIETPPYKEFVDYDAAIAYVKKRDCRLVSKPCGDADKALTYAAGGPDPVSDMIFMLQKWKKQQKLKGAFILQDFIEGIEMSADGWLGPHGFDLGWGESFEFKKLMSSNYGVNTGEMGTVLRFTRNSKLANTVLKPLGSTLVKNNYCGYISVNTIIDKRGTPWFLEFTVRPGYPTINIEAAIHSEADPVTRLFSLANGIDCRSVILDKIAIGVVVALPGFPHSHSLAKDIIGLPIYGLSNPFPSAFPLRGTWGQPRIWDHVHLAQCKMDEDQVQTAGDYCLVVTSASSTVSSARHAVYDRVRKLHIPGGISVRDDIGERLSKQLPELHKHGYAAGLEY